MGGGTKSEDEGGGEGEGEGVDEGDGAAEVEERGAGGDEAGPKELVTLVVLGSKLVWL